MDPMTLKTIRVAQHVGVVEGVAYCMRASRQLGEGWEEEAVRWAREWGGEEDGDERES